MQNLISKVALCAIILSSTVYPMNQQVSKHNKNRTTITLKNRPSNRPTNLDILASVAINQDQKAPRCTLCNKTYYEGCRSFRNTHQ